MFASNDIQFRDPFVNSHRRLHLPRSTWPDQYPSAYAPPLTPPREMLAVPTPARFQQQEQRRSSYGEYLSEAQAHNGSYRSRDVSITEVGREISAVRPVSPVKSAIPEESQSRRGSQAQQIAESFQIPKSVNDSGGSLSELAAQITCLFWFESAEVLQQVEDSSSPIMPNRPLVPDARPSTGFRKWVTTILSTTLVAQNVVLLALLFIHRLKKLNPTVKGKLGSEYRLLTVALMLGNKYLDDNTYTNKTWAEVSGINVGEIHIMEVEFLSNMKYCLFTSADHWTEWQTLLGKFAAFWERGTKPIRSIPTLPPASSLNMPMAMPSPPASNQASPPYMLDLPTIGFGGTPAVFGQTPAPSPLPSGPSLDNRSYQQKSRKRSLDDYSAEPPAKRMVGDYYSSKIGTSIPSISTHGLPRLPLPGLVIPSGIAPSAFYTMPPTQSQQLPPINMSSRAMGAVYSSHSSQTQVPVISATSGALPPNMNTQHASRPHSPLANSTRGSPAGSMPTSATRLQPPTQISPSYFLRDRDSPYRPVRNVSTLLYPPPSDTLHRRNHSVEQAQMTYQQLGKSVQHQQNGRLPYIAQNIWLDSHGQPAAMTPVAQWPGFEHNYSNISSGLPPQ